MYPPETIEEVRAFLKAWRSGCIVFAILFILTFCVAMLTRHDLNSLKAQLAACETTEKAEAKHEALAEPFAEHNIKSEALAEPAPLPDDIMEEITDSGLGNEKRCYYIWQYVEQNCM